MNSSEKPAVKSKRDNICLPADTFRQLVNSGVIPKEIGNKLYVLDNMFTSRYGNTQMISIPLDWNKPEEESSAA